MLYRSHSLACSHSYSATTGQLVDEYGKKLQHFMTGATVSHFKQLFPATATPSKLSRGKVKVKLKIENYWDKSTLDDLTKLVALLGISDSHLHLSEVGEGCIAIVWLCSSSEVKQLEMGISDSADSLQSLGVLQVFVGKKLVVDCSQFHLSASGKINNKREDFIQATSIGWQWSF